MILAFRILFFIAFCNDLLFGAVSYTHLRPAGALFHLRCTHDHWRDPAFSAGQSANPASMLAVHPPVSYTHLEVYKRQPIKSSFEDAGSVEEMMLYTELQSAVHAMIDVDKRQGPTFTPSMPQKGQLLNREAS